MLESEFVGKRVDFVRVADEDDVRDLVGKSHVRRGQSALFK